MKPLAVIVLAGMIAGCTSGPFAFKDIWRDAAQDPVADSDSEITKSVTNTARRAAQSSPTDGGIGDASFRTEQAQALRGNRDSAFRVALMFKEGLNGVPRDEHQMVRWLRRASELDSGVASYQLYLHYLSRGLDRDAVLYENRALRQGFVPPPRLDARRG